MSFDLAALSQAVARQGRVVRIVVAGTEGSAPREVGAAMLVWMTGQSGTIGGGALEHAAVQSARGSFAAERRVERIALGPSLGQCCGGAVTLLFEGYDAAGLEGLGPDGLVARPMAQTPMPLAVKRLLARARGQGIQPPPQMLQGWMIEPVTVADRHLWIWGAGHVGRALVGVMAPLPAVAITWADTATDRFPAIPEGVTQLVATNPADLVPYAPRDADHLIVTFSHALDLDLCHRLLDHGFASAGLIGSATKWARFRSRLKALGHADPAIARITCPIGTPGFGKHPQAIAIGVAAAFLSQRVARAAPQERTG